MKFLTTTATARIVMGHSSECLVYRKIASANPNSPGYKHCLTLRHCFTANSAAGVHICFVIDALSSSLANLRPHGQNRFTLPIAKRITKQVLLALDYLHRECGYIHTGGSGLAPILIYANDRMLRHQIRQHPSFNTSTSSFSNRKIYFSEPSHYLWSSTSPGVVTLTSRILMFGTSTLSQPL